MSFSEINFTNKIVFIRVDYNVPVVEGVIKNISRIIAVKSSIKKLISNKNKIFLISHFGRPKGKFVDKFSLNFIINSLKEVLEIDKLYFLKNLNKDNINQTSNEMKSGEVCLIENIRFQKEEENIDLNFAKNLSSLFLREFYRKLRYTFTPGLENVDFHKTLNAGNFIKEARRMSRSFQEELRNAVEDPDIEMKARAQGALLSQEQNSNDEPENQSS